MNELASSILNASSSLLYSPKGTPVPLTFISVRSGNGNEQHFPRFGSEPKTSGAHY
jgi:hypothetical protein